MNSAQSETSDVNGTCNKSNRRTPTTGINFGFMVDWIGTFAVFFVYAGEAVPGVNEPHYWTKAYHFWHLGFGQGDLFLESGDAHWLFFATFGFMTRLFPLFIAVWVVRFLMWSALAAGWVWMIRSAFGQSEDGSASNSVAKMPGAAALAAGVWLAGLHWGHLAGEWVVGGAEAKEIAYAFLFGGLGFLFQKRPTTAWSLIGIGTAFHVVTGFWIIASSLIVLFLFQISDTRNNSVSIASRIQSSIKEHATGLSLCFLFSLIGIVPALMIDWSVPAEIANFAATKQVYGRLSHHLAPSMITAFRWQCFILHLFVAGTIIWLLRWCVVPARSNSKSNIDEHVMPSTELRFGLIPKHLPFGLQFLVLNAIVALVIAIIGMLIDRVVGGLSRDLAAKLLRFYWFRWNDVALPLSSAVIVVSLAYGRIWFANERWVAQVTSISCCMAAAGLVLSVRYFENTSELFPFGDRAKLINKQDTLDDQRRHYHDWLSVCEWIRNNTDPKKLWVTPRNQQSFKWHTGRAELANWKDMPQDARSIVEWTHRLDSTYSFNAEKILQPWTTEQLWKLHREYGVQYILMDRRVIGQTPPLLPILYPQSDRENSTFCVFEFTDSPILSVPLSDSVNDKPEANVTN